MLVERISEGLADEQRIKAMLTTGAAVTSAAAATTTTVAAAVPAAAPAGGAGAAAGGWDTAANRDAAIATINGLQTFATEQKANFNAAVADVADIRTQLNALLTELRNRKIIGA